MSTDRVEMFSTDFMVRDGEPKERALEAMKLCKIALRRHVEGLGLVVVKARRRRWRFKWLAQAPDPGCCYCLTVWCMPRVDDAPGRS